MDYTKTKTFIAFISKSKKDSYWIDGNYVFDESSPKIYPYESKEDKDLANVIGYRHTQWDEVEREKLEIVGVLLKVSEQVPIISKERALELDEKVYGKSAILKEIVKNKKKEPEAAQEIVNSVPESTEPAPEVPKRKRGRPAKVIPKQISLDIPEQKNYIFGEPEKTNEEKAAEN